MSDYEQENVKKLALEAKRHNEGSRSKLRDWIRELIVLLYEDIMNTETRLHFNTEFKKG
jgi:hypothetical protein